VSGRGALRLGIALAAVLAFVPAAYAVQVQQVTSDAGITAWLVEDHSVPVVSLHAAFRGGAALDPDDRAGLAVFTAELLDEGASDLDSTAFQSKVEDLSASLEFGAGQDNMTLALHSLAKNLGPSVDLLHLALTAPRFDAEPVARVRAEMLNSLARDQRQPNAIAYRLWWKTEFADNPYGRSTRGTPESIARITPDDMRALVHARFARDVLVVAVVGDITAAQLKPVLDQAFASLPEHAAPNAFADTAPAGQNDVVVSQLPVPQSVVVFGQKGLKRNDPDWYAALLVLNILSAGGLTSRVALEVREERGLAYSISASLYPLRHAGVILGQLGSQNARVAESLDLVRKEWQRMHDDGPTPKELADSKTYLTGSFALGLDSTGRIAGTLLSIQLDGLGIDYLDRRNSLIDGVSLADAKRVAKRVLDPEGLFFVVVGSPEKLGSATRIAPGG